MLVQTRIPWRELANQVLVALVAVAGYSILISWLDVRFHLEELHLPVGLLTLLGTTLGILLAFRTNASYQRWWEARIIWGQIVNDSRTWVRQLQEFVEPGEDPVESSDVVVRRMAHRQIAWCFALARTLRDQPWIDNVQGMVSEEEKDQLSTIRNVPNALLSNQSIDLRKLRKREAIDPFQFVTLEQTLTRLTNSMGGCERIKNTPFPRTYRQWILFLVYCFVVLLPFALVEMPAYGLVMTSIPIALGFLVVERIAVYLEDPFIHRAASTPMLALSRTIEINIRQMLGETETPPPLEPEHGVLY